jgi:hypothetical protein
VRVKSVIEGKYNWLVSHVQREIVFKKRKDFLSDRLLLLLVQQLFLRWDLVL